MPRPAARTSRRADLAERKNQSKTQQKLLVAVIAVVAVLAVAIMVALSGGDDTPPVAPVAAGEGTTAAATSSRAAPAAAAPASAERDPVRAKVQELLQAIQEGDRETLAKSINFPRWNDALVAEGKAEKRWDELDSLGQTLARQQICESLVADDKTRDFMRQATIRSYVPMQQDEQGAKVQVIQQHMIETKREQERTIELSKQDGVWFLASMKASAIQTPEEMKAAADTVRSEERAKRVGRDLAPIERQEPLADTPPEVQSAIDAACATLADTSATKEVTKAKRELVAIGKPAIPALLNLVVGHEELASRDDQIIVHNALSTLRDLTHEDFGYAPGGIGGTMTGDIKTENVTAIKRWFGWWRDNKNRWKGPRAPEDE